MVDVVRPHASYDQVDCCAGQVVPQPALKEVRKGIPQLLRDNGLNETVQPVGFRSNAKHRVFRGAHPVTVAGIGAMLYTKC